jgi:hypothetical protein
MKLFVAAVATATVALAGPAQAATLSVDPAQRCYLEGSRVLLPGSGYTPNQPVEFTRDGNPLGTIMADASGSLLGDLMLPGFPSGQQELTYRGTDTANPANFAEVTLLVTSLNVGVSPKNGAAARRLTIKARGFFGGKTLWAHITREGGGARATAARNLRVGRLKGACKKVSAKKRFFSASTRPGLYRIQFDTFRRYKAKRELEFEIVMSVTRVFRPAGVATSVRRVG